MPEVTIKPAGDIVPGVPSWRCYIDDAMCVVVWRDSDRNWQAVYADDGHSAAFPSWEEACQYSELPPDTPEPTPAPEVETVEVRGYVVAGRDHWRAAGSATWSHEVTEHHCASMFVAGGADHHMQMSRFSWVTARVPLPAKPAEVVGDVSDG